MDSEILEYRYSETIICCREINYPANKVYPSFSFKKGDRITRDQWENLPGSIKINFVMDDRSEYITYKEIPYAVL